MSFATPPPPTKTSALSFPAPHIMLLTLNRPRSLNCINTAGHQELDAVYEWFDHEPSLRVGIVTGEGRAFCAGADLKEWASSNRSPHQSPRSPFPPSGFGALSTRTGLKPIIAAVNGLCLGGGFEMAINCDLVVAASSAILGLPEVKRGVVAVAGALPRLVRVVGKQRAMEMCLTGRHYPAGVMREWGVVNKVVDVPQGAGVEEVNRKVVQEAVRLATEVGGNSPDAVVVSREGVNLGWQGIGVKEGTERLREGLYGRIEGEENMVEGVRAFVEKREPRWVGSKL